MAKRKRHRKDPLRLRKAKAEHEKFLKSVGADKARRSRDYRAPFPDYKLDREPPPTSNSVGYTPTREIRTHDAEERPETLQEIAAKSKRVAPGYNKGGYQYITPGTDLKSVGRK